MRGIMSSRPLNHKYFLPLLLENNPLLQRHSIKPSIVHVANPIYDSVFKYIMEDERIAKTVLSALLKKEVVHVTVRPHEYANTTRNAISMFRIDFAATVVEDDGSEQVILIELQKTWLNTETLRFRQYLGVQYGNQCNIQVDSKEGYAYPMVAVYLLGHRVGNIDTPVLYVNHKTYDYEGAEVAEGMTDPFVESLTHDSIIVQIPLLKGRVNNRLEKVLSVFDQSKTDSENKQLLNIDEHSYEDDADMMYVIHRLTAAAADADIRSDMNVEDEYFSAIEDRDTEIMTLGEELKQQRAANKKQEDTLRQQEDTLRQQEDTLRQQNLMLKSMVKAMLEKGMSIKEVSLLVNKDVAFLENLMK